MRLHCIFVLNFWLGLYDANNPLSTVDLQPAQAAPPENEPIASKVRCVASFAGFQPFCALFRVQAEPAPPAQRKDVSHS